MPSYRNKLFLIPKLINNIIKHPISEQEQLAKKKKIMTVTINQSLTVKSPNLRNR